LSSKLSVKDKSRYQKNKISVSGRKFFTNGNFHDKEKSERAKKQNITYKNEIRIQLTFMA